VRDGERRARPRPDVVFKVEGTAIGHAVRTLEPLLIGDLKEAASEYIDANVLNTAGFKSALVVPLVSNGRGVGTLNVVARGADAFDLAHVETLRPIAEILAVAHVAQQLHMRIGQYRTIETMADLTLSIAAEINSALQTIIGHCALLERGYPEPSLQRDLATVTRQAQRIAELLDKMRTATNERLKEVAETMEDTGIPTSPEAYET
jgi:transcriptional regulator with GAF, ATPase, and Fis domain